MQLNKIKNNIVNIFLYEKHQFTYHMQIASI